MSGVAEICLELQDQLNLDVNIVLFCFWGAHIEEAPTELQWEEIIEFSSFCDIQLMRQIGCFLNGLMEIIKLNQWSKHQRLSRILRKKLKMLEKESSDFFKCIINRLRSAITAIAYDYIFISIIS